MGDGIFTKYHVRRVPLYGGMVQCTLGYAIHHGTEANGLHKQEWLD